jgi:hypothetical protein
MCPFCIGAATWAAAGVLSTAGGLGALAAVVQRRGAGEEMNQPVIRAVDSDKADDGKPPSSTRLT